MDVDADDMSSPDPLNDATTFLAPPSSQRLTRSYRSTRFASLGRSVSPRKQQFELEVGGNRSPQRLLVTVETEDEDAPATATRRRLFPSSSPFKGGAGMAATTTTVPLKDSIEDEFGEGSLTTPKKRGRPRKTNGTPLPSAAKKRRAPTPLKRTPKRANTGKEVATSSIGPLQPTPTPKRRGRPPKNSVEPSSDTGFQVEPMSEPLLPTPTPKRRGRPPKGRPVEPSSDLGINSQQKPSAAQGRRRRQALAPEDLEVMAEETEPIPEQYDANDEDAMDLVEIETNDADNEDASAAKDRDFDIWMNTMSEQATPRAATRKSASGAADSPSPPQPEPNEPPIPDDMESVASEAEGFGEGAPSVSDAGSIMNAPYHSATRRNDTVAQEDFSMIFMDSIQSYQDLRSSKQGPEPAVEEETGGKQALVDDELDSLQQGAEIEGEFDEDQLIVEEAVNEVAGDLVEDANDEAMDEMDLLEAPEELAENIAEEMDQGEPDGPEVTQETSNVAVDEKGFLEQDHMSEDNVMAEGTVHREADHGPEVDIDMVRRGTTEEVDEPTDEPMEYAVPDLDESAASSSPSHPAGEPDEPEMAQTSSPMRSAGLSSKFGASPWLSRTPRRPDVSPLRRQLLSSFTKNDATSRPLQTYNDSPLGAGPASSQGANPSRIAEDELNLYEDSFSEIPEAVLLAATPRRLGKMPVAGRREETGVLEMDEEVNVTEKQHEDVDIGPEDAEAEEHEELGLDKKEQQQQQQQPLGYTLANQQQLPVSSNASSLAQTDNARLPTPDDTPPDINVATDQSEKLTQAPPTAPSPGPEDQLASEHAAAPSPAQDESPPQPPRVTLERGSSVPEITPVNQISSPIEIPPSSHSQTSPEKGPRPALSAIVRAGRVLQNVTSDPPSPGDRRNQLGSPFRSSASKESRGSREPSSQRPSASPGRRSVSHHRKSVSLDRLVDDPFASRPNIPRGQGSFMQALGRSVSGNASKSKISNPGSAAGSVRFSPQHDEMSWLPDAEPANPSPMLNQSPNEAAQSSPSRPPTSIARSSTDRHTGPAERDDETDIWELEAQRDEPESSRKETSFLSMTSAPLHRRPAIPSPWTRKSELAQANAAQLAASRMAHGASREDQGQQEDEGEGYSLLAQRQKAQEAEAAKGPGSSAKANRFDLSSFFSSPAAIGGKLVEKFFPSKNTGQGDPETAEEPTAMPHSTMFPAVPQKQFEPSSEGRPDLFSPARSQQPQQPQSPSRPFASYSQEGHHESQETAAQEQQGAVDVSASPETPEQLQRPVSAQKKDFTPRSRQTNQSFFQPSSARSAALTPPRMQLSYGDIARWQQEASNASSDEPTSPRRFLRALPPRNASPSKSAIRSPLKPRTPGRVVEFTSSVLSPIEQAKQRQQRHSFLQDDEAVEDTSHLSQAHATGEENEEEDTSMMDAPQTRTVDPKALSRDVWSREHWLFLDKLLQHRKSSRFGIECTPHSAKFLGKTVKGDGESLKLEQWHLDCVDAFKAVVGGWDAGALCKRMFSLIKAEQKRAGRPVGAEDTEMFH